MPDPMYVCPHCGNDGVRSWLRCSTHPGVHGYEISCSKCPYSELHIGFSVIKRVDDEVISDAKNNA